MVVIIEKMCLPVTVSIDGGVLEGDIAEWDVELVEDTERCGTRRDGVVVGLFADRDGLPSTGGAPGAPTNCLYELSNHGLNAVLLGMAYGLCLTDVDLWCKGECLAGGLGLLAATSAIDHILGLLPVCSSGEDTGDCVAVAMVVAVCTVGGTIDGAACFCGELLSVSKSLKSTKEYYMDIINLKCSIWRIDWFLDTQAFSL